MYSCGASSYRRAQTGCRLYTQGRFLRLKRVGRCPKLLSIFLLLFF